MEKELKISELASIWGASVPTTWNRIRKEGLTTFKKKDETNKEVSYVSVSEEILNRYINNTINNNNNHNNNGYYEDILSVENVNNNINNPQAQQNYGFMKDDLKDLIKAVANVNDEHNERLQTLTDRLIIAESKTLLLEDKANREGYYINEINELKKENNRNKLYNNVLITIIILLLLLITSFITYNFAVNKIGQPKEDAAQEQAQTTPATPAQPPAAAISTPTQKASIKKR